MTTEILGLDEILASQSQKEVAHNTALRQIEGRLVRALSKSLAVPPSSPAEGASYIVAASPTGAWSGQANKIAHFFGGAWKFWQPVEGASLTVVDEKKRYVYYSTGWEPDGGDTAVVVTQPFDLTAFYPGVPGAGAIVTRVPVARAVTFPAALAGSIGRASVAAAAQADFDVQKNGVSVGTIRFAAGAAVASFMAASDITLAAGDVLAVIAPTPADAALANVGLVLAGTR